MATGRAQSNLRAATWCTSCQRDAFAALGTPILGEESMYCRLLIPSSCGVCSPSLGVSRSGYVVDVSESEMLSRGEVVKLYLPQSAINSMLTILNLARHQAGRGEKLAQYEAQIEHMFKAYTKDPNMAFALRSLAQLICMREQDSAQFIFATVFQPGAAIFSNKQWFDERLVPEGEYVGWVSWAFGWHRCVQTVHQRWTLEVGTGDIHRMVPVASVASAEDDGCQTWSEYLGSFCGFGRQAEYQALPFHSIPEHWTTFDQDGNQIMCDVGDEQATSLLPPLPYETQAPPFLTGRGDEGKLAPHVVVESVDLDDSNAVLNCVDGDADRHSMEEIIADSATLESISMTPPPDMANETPLDGGNRTAERRAPHLGPMPYFFNNSGDNLSLANHLRNNGDAGPVREPEFAKLIDEAVEAFCKIVISEKKCSNLVVKEFTDELPKKYTVKERQSYERDMWYLNCHGLPPKISTSIKAEVVGKPKPRPIQAHGVERLALNSPLFGTWERILKARLGRFTIKGKKKQLVFEKICHDANNLAAHGPLFPLQFDQTAFEFGINESFKNAEVKMLTKVASLLKSDYSIYPDDLVDACIAERKNKIDWVMNTKDGRGYRHKHVIEMFTTMRQSGDRGTSSLNWLANALWVCISLCRPGCYEEFWENMCRAHLARNRGHFNFPAWDGHGRVAIVVNMEGDDLIGFADRGDCVKRMLDVAHAVGWKAKDEFIAPDPVTGNGHVTYVGYHLYTKNNVPCMVSGQFVMYPELKRFMTTKSWGSIVMEPSERAACEVLNYAVYAKAFEHLEPISHLCLALANGWRRRHMMFGNDVGAPKAMQVTNKQVIRDIEYRVGCAIDDEQIVPYLLGAKAPSVTEEITDIGLAMSSHVCGHPWGVVMAEDVCDLIGMVEMEPLANAADLRCRVPRCWWAK